ncbi:MAG: Thioredoxin [Alphaproteobacteria bacterium MarineAlpha9_Bin4]|nr:thioredoxin [Pelagibacterales bacterium]PPR26819.1 MAG: Thioredoxin [Alphaproteobacteria bacterium MarineAlpha9_Bin4]|tara:strand:- start:928 stop:1824 length:897 start_codon:yes stop_codon:yes gene_type:complete
MNMMENLIEDVDTPAFMDKVIKESKDCAVVVDFWAPWCEPCKQITPILEQLVNQYQGKAKLVKVNIDENQQLAQQLNIQSIPTVMAFYEGQPINGFTGLKSPEDIKVFFDEVVASSSMSSKLIEEVNKKLELAEGLLEKKEIEKAMEVFSELIASDLPKTEMGKAMSGLGKCLLEINKYEELEDLINQLEDDIKETNDVKDLIEAKNFFSKIMELTKDTKANSDNKNELDNKLQLARNFLLEKNYPESIDMYLSIIEKNNGWRDGMAKNELLSLFSFLGNNNNFTISGRSKLLNLLYK